MKTYKLNHTTAEWDQLIENCEIQMREKGIDEANIDAVIHDLKNPKKHSKTKSLFQMSDATAKWLQYEINYRIGWTEDVIRESDSWSAYEERKYLSQLKTLKKQLESQL